MNESKETKEEVTLGELKVWLNWKFETIDERFKAVDARFSAVDDKFSSFKWWVGLLVVVFIAVSAGQFVVLNQRMDRLEALILKNRDEIALNWMAIVLNGKAIEVNKALIEEAKCQCEPKILK